MGLLDQLKSLVSSAPDANLGRATITVYDKFGRQLEIERDEWRTHVLPQQLIDAHDDADALYAAIVGALEDGFVDDVLPATERLYEIDTNPERCHTVRGIALLQSGDLEGAGFVLSDYLERFGPSGVVLTNLAKLQAARGLEAQSEATLWLALSYDPNQENALLWYGSIHRERQGNEGLWQAIERVAELPGSWRPQLWLARNALERRELNEARRLYSHVLDQAADEPDVLMMISGDLGNNGYASEVLNIVGPVYEPHRHNPLAGLNLLRAHLQMGNLVEGQELLHELFALNRPDLRDRLFAISNEFGNLEQAEAVPQPTEDQPLAVELVTLERPIWLSGLHDPAWLFPADKGQGPEIAFLALANVTGAEQADPSVQREDDLGRLTRSLPMYLAESTWLRSGRRTCVVLPAVRGAGPVVSGQPWPEESIFHCAGDAPLAVSGSLDGSGDELRVELSLWDCTSRRRICQLDFSMTPDELGTTVQELDHEILEALEAASAAEGRDQDDRPGVEEMPLYLLCLGHSLTLSLVQSGVIRRDAMWGERNMYQAMLALVLEMPKALAPKLMFLGALAKGHDFGSLVYSEFKQPALQLIEDERDRNSPLYRLSPLFLKAFDMHRFGLRRDELLATAQGPFRAWLESLSEA